MCIDNFDFMAISQQTGLNGQISGILGLGANLKDGPSFVESLTKSGLIEKAILSFSLGYKGPNFEIPSYMIFGGTNSSQYVGDLHSFPLKTNTWWALDMREFSYNGISMASFSPSDKAIAVIDTGTSLASIPSSIHKRLI